MSAASSRVVLFGRVEHVMRSGALLVVARAGVLARNVVCPAVDGVDLGDEVQVELGADDLGTILERKARR